MLANQWILAATLLLAPAACAQRFHPPVAPSRPPDKTLDALVETREKLIKRFVLGSHEAWGVSIEGSYYNFIDDRQLSWLTIYAYRDALPALLADLEKLAGAATQGKVFEIDGIFVEVETVDRPKRREEHKNEQSRPQPRDERHSYVRVAGYRA